MPRSNRSILLAAQPIYNSENRIRGVELLYRDEQSRAATMVGEAHATRELLLNLCAGITDQVDHYHTPAFINVSVDFLLSGAFLPIDPEFVMIELVERIEPTDELVEAVRNWHERGFRFALDDFGFTEAWDPLLGLASVIKVDVQDWDFDELLAHKQGLEQLDCEWLAERVEDRETWERYRGAGFTLFQGYYLARPVSIYGKRPTPAALQVTRVIQTLYKQDPDWREVTAAISQDPALAMSLIKIANSPLFRTNRNQISTLDGVVKHLGFNAVRRWAVLIAAHNASSPEVARIVLQRALFCRELAERHKSGVVNSDHAFLAGLLSGGDALLEVDMETLLSEIDLEPEIRRAVTHHDGPVGWVLSKALHVEVAVAMKTELAAMDERLLGLYRIVGDRVQSMFNELPGANPR